MTKLAPEWVRTGDPVIRSPAKQYIFIYITFQFISGVSHYTGMVFRVMVSSWNNHIYHLVWRLPYLLHCVVLRGAERCIYIIDELS